MKALDLFCGGGGAARGMLAAGFDEVVGIDIADHRKSYPGLFIRGDALSPPVRLEDFDFIWASPPCQIHSAQLLNQPQFREQNVDLIPATRKLISDHPMTVIENVPLAPVRRDLALSGPQVGLPRLRRVRHFEMSFPVFEPPRPRLPTWRDGLVTVSRKGGYSVHQRKIRKARGMPGSQNKADGAEAMGLPMTMTRYEIGEAVPPAYAEYIAREALRQMQ